MAPAAKTEMRLSDIPRTLSTCKEKTQRMQDVVVAMVSQKLDLCLGCFF